MAFRPRPVRTACLMQASLMTGNMPGIAASTSETWELGSPPNSVEAPENSFEFEVTWAWASMPMTTSQSPVEPLISFELVALMLVYRPAAAPRRLPPIRHRANRSRPVCEPAGTNRRRCRDRLRHDADKHGPRPSQRSVHPERSCAPRPKSLSRPTTARQAARRGPAQG